jgi:hypothetical protein
MRKLKMSENTFWEYHIEVIGSSWRGLKPEVVTAALNEFGEMGWEVVNLHQPQNSNKMWVALKRPLSHGSRRQRSRPEESW